MTDKLTITEYPAVIRVVRFPPMDMAAYCQSSTEHKRLIGSGWALFEHVGADNGNILRYVKQLEPAK